MSQSNENKAKQVSAVEEFSTSYSIERGRVSLQKGFIYRDSQSGRDCELVEFLDDNYQILVRYLDDLTIKTVSFKQLKNVKDPENAHVNIDLSDISEAAWEKAQVKYQAIKPLLKGYANTRTISKRAAETGISQRTLYRWLEAYNSIGSIVGLIEKKRGWVAGNSRLSVEQDRIIESVIENFYLTKQRPGIEHTVREVHRICHLEHIAKPSKMAVRQRIYKIGLEQKLRKRGQKELANQKFKPVPNNFPGADKPLSFIQIDHTPVDLILVDNIYRKPIGKAYLTLAIDVYSRMVAGYYLSLDAPSVTSVAMCISRCILPKDELLQEHGLTGVEWNVFGYPAKIHVDNGADFRSTDLIRSCAMHGIELHFRPAGQPQFGGAIERIIGTFMKEVHNLAGTTFSNIKEKDTYNSEKEASLTFDEFEKWLLLYITKIYHQRVHSTLGCTPAKKWKIGILGDKNNRGAGIPTLPQDEHTLFLDFLPCFQRTIQTFGVTIEGLHYYDACLNPYINATDQNGNNQKYLFRRDPRDISRIWFKEPNSGLYYSVPFANQKLPSMSLWEYELARKNIKDRNIKYTNEQQVYDALTEMREMVEIASKNTKKARRQEQRSKVHKRSQQYVQPVVEQQQVSFTNNGKEDGFLAGDIDFGSVEVD